MHKEMNRMYNVFNEISKNAPKELTREYETQEGGKVREVGPIVYGYSMTIGPDGKPYVKEFGNVKSCGNNASNNLGQYVGAKPQICRKRTHLRYNHNRQRGQSSTGNARYKERKY
jgi:HSP20 family protein